ncbi:MAG: nucleoside monophosphate kinase [Phycisphaerales bacterium]|nr:nucleoside monophosphate kinase [Phycisphaerales bacterium]
MEAKLKSILLFGQPGVGKGTQGTIVGRVPGFCHLATGDMFRGLDRDSELGREFLKYSTQGLLVPDELTCRLWRQYVQGLIDTNKYLPGSDALLLDGIPRSPAQAKTLDDHIEVLAIVHLVCADEEELIQRMKRRADIQNRPDDADETVIRRRFEVFHSETAAVLDHYDPKLIHTVTATGSPGKILLNILNAVNPSMEGHFGNPLG